MVIGKQVNNNLSFKTHLTYTIFQEREDEYTKVKKPFDGRLF